MCWLRVAQLALKDQILAQDEQRILIGENKCLYQPSIRSEIIIIYSLHVEIQLFQCLFVLCRTYLRQY